MFAGFNVSSLTQGSTAYVTTRLLSTTDAALRGKMLDDMVDQAEIIPACALDTENFPGLFGTRGQRYPIRPFRRLRARPSGSIWFF